MQTFEETGLSRIPIHEGSIDHVAGILHVKDVLAVLSKGERDFVPRSLLRAPLYLPESQKIDDALASMRAQKTHLAIIMDEFGGTAGLLTVEDILEELVGEIADEHDMREEAPFVALDERTALVDARLHAEDLRDEWGLELPVREFDTVGGFMIERLGRAPVVGDVVELPGACLQVFSMRGRRPRKIKIIRETPEEAAEA
jgi:CBS domain containing-hemolysin-like protein